MKEEGQKKSDAVILGEIMSLAFLVIALVLILIYFSSDKIEIDLRKGSPETPEQRLREKEQLITQTTGGTLNAAKQYFIENRRAIVIAGYAVLSLVIFLLGAMLVVYMHRKVLFKRQNRQSQEKIAQYEKSIHPIQKS